MHEGVSAGCSSDYWHTPPQPQHARHSLVRKQRVLCQQLRQLRDGFDVRSSAANDEPLHLLAGSPPVDKPGMQSHTGPANDPRPVVAEAAMAESLDHLAGDSRAAHNDEFRTELLPATQLLPSLSVETIGDTHMCLCA